MNDNPLTGKWTYRSFINNPDVTTAFNDLEFGRGTIVLDDAPMSLLKGTIGGPGWSLKLKGSRSYGNPMELRFEGKGVVGGAEWIYAYVGYLVPAWPNGVQQVPAIVGSVIRVIPHPSGSGGGTSPAGVVASFVAVRA